VSSKIKPHEKPLKVRNIFSIIWRVAFAILIIIGAVFYAKIMIADRPEAPKRQARERSFTVSVIEPKMGVFSPSIQAFGEIIASYTIDIRSQVSGEAINVSKNLIIGGAVEKGEILVEIDNFNYDGSVREVKATLSDAQLQFSIAKDQLELEKINLKVAQEQFDLAKKDLERMRALHKSGSITNKELENNIFTLSQREQSVAQRQTSLKVQEASIERQEQNIIRAKWNLEKAQRSLENTKIISPFDGIVLSKTAIQGKIITNNEIIAQLYEADRLEVHFTLSDAQYGQLLSDGLIGRSLEVTWNIEPDAIIAKGEISRIGAQVNAAKGGVEIFATLQGEGIKNLKPGIFVEVMIKGISYDNAILIPETAIYENSHFYVVRDGRMSRTDMKLLARDGENVIVRAVISDGDRIIITRVAQAGDGLKITIEGEENTPANGKAEQGESKDGARRQPPANNNNSDRSAN
jgi:RND family efflux transporter MFP subunit